MKHWDVPWDSIGKPWDLGPNIGKFRRLSWDFEKILASNTGHDSRPIACNTISGQQRYLAVCGPQRPLPAGGAVGLVTRRRRWCRPSWRWVMSGDESADVWFAGLQPCACRLWTCRLCPSSSPFRLLKGNGIISLDSGLIHDFNRIKQFPSWVVG